MGEKSSTFFACLPSLMSSVLLNGEILEAGGVAGWRRGWAGTARGMVMSPGPAQFEPGASFKLSCCFKLQSSINVRKGNIVLTGLLFSGR